MADTIFFDLDGTLTESGPGIMNSVAYALKKYGIEGKSAEWMRRFVGPPLVTSFIEYCGFSEEEAKNAVQYYREYYRTKGLFENSVYPGVQETLKELKRRGKLLMVATSKPELFAKQVLDYFDLAQYFTFIGGSTMEESRTRKSEVIEYVIETCKITDRSGILMVGDRSHDVIGAKETKVSSAGVLYGYGTRDELQEAGADYILEKIEELLEIV